LQQQSTYLHKQATFCSFKVFLLAFQWIFNSVVERRSRVVASIDLHHYPFLEPGTRLQLPGYPLPGFHPSSRYPPPKWPIICRVGR